MLLAIDVNGVHFQVFDAGSGPTILFVHGFPLDHTMWHAQLEEFSKTHRVIAPDLRGFGGTDGGLYSISMEQFADDLAAILETLQVVGPIIFCGLSMGGYIGWQFVQRHPDRLSKLIVCDSRAGADTAEAAANRLRMADIVLREGSEAIAWAMMPKLFARCSSAHCPHVIASVRAMVLNTDPRSIAAAHRGMAIRPDATALLPRIHCPTLILVGEYDQISTHVDMKSLADALPNATFRLIKDAGHMAPMEQPEAVNTVIRQFISTPDLALKYGSPARSHQP